MLAKVTRSTKRDRGQESCRCIAGSAKWNEERIDVRHAALARERADETDASVSQQCSRKVDATCTVVIAAKDNDLKARPSLRRCVEEGKEPAHGGDWWVGDIVDIARHQKDICTDLVDLLKKPCKKDVMLFLARMCMQLMAEVPVGCVNQSQ